MQGVVILLNMGLYTTVPLIVAFFLMALADFIHALGSQAGLLNAVGTGLFLAATLTIAGISALVVEV